MSEVTKTEMQNIQLAVAELVSIRNSGAILRASRNAEGTKHWEDVLAMARVNLAIRRLKVALENVMRSDEVG